MNEYIAIPRFLVMAAISFSYIYEIQCVVGVVGDNLRSEFLSCPVSVALLLIY